MHAIKITFIISNKEEKQCVKVNNKDTSAATLLLFVISVQTQ